MITVISKDVIFFLSLSLTHTSTKIPLSAHECFFTLRQPFFRIFFSINYTHSRDLFSILRNKTFGNRFYIKIVSSLKSTTRCIDTTVSKSFISSSKYKRTAKLSYGKKDIFH